MSRKTLASIQTNGNGSGNENKNKNASDANSSDFHSLCFNVNDFQVLARKRLPKDLYEYLASGSDDEQTLAENRKAFSRWFLRPRVLRPVGNISTKTVLRFGTGRAKCEVAYPVSMPVFVSPAGVHALCDKMGECATARACAKASILFGLSQHSTKSIEEVAAATQSRAMPSSTLSPSLKFYQSYILNDRRQTINLIRRAIRAGYQGLFLTVDSVRFGYREADARNGFNALPPPHRLVNYDEFDYNSNDDDINGADNDSKCSSRRLEQTYNSQEKKAWDQNSEQMFEQNVSWEDVRWIKRELRNEQEKRRMQKPIPLVIKGILTAEDAVLAVQAGADAILLSNHGGRQLDGCLSAIDVLPEVAHAIKTSGIPIWIDGGIRRGTDVLKALGTSARIRDNSTSRLKTPTIDAIAVSEIPS